MWKQLTYVTAALALPVAWGWLVHVAFNRYLRRGKPGEEDHGTFSDYQI